MAPSCLRRCPKTRITNAENGAHGSTGRAPARGRMASMALVTLGAGQKQPGGSTATCSTSARSDMVTLMGPYASSPALAINRSPTSRWMVTNCPRHSGWRSSSVAISGVAAWYGRLATRTNGRPASASKAFAPSACLPSRQSASTIVTLPGAAPMRCALRLRTISAMSRSSSQATTSQPASMSVSVSVPVPGPTSSTSSPGCTLAAVSSLRSWLWSCRKFWPNLCFGRMPRAASSSRISVSVCGISARSPRRASRAAPSP